ncbi:MAG: hypothetical protein JW751_20975 [Polyangiaceae bacterium]|nr:hypothetical protein [Polyangiaceae bacterium]
MAVYEYEILGEDGSPQGIFEIEQKMSEPALSHHPKTGAPLRRILSATFARSHGNADGGVSSCATGACGLPSVGGCAGGSCDFE